MVEGNLIITAAHCIHWRIEGSMALGDYFIEDINTSSGEKLKVMPMAVEPVSDIAVLGPLDNQQFFDEVEEFENFCERTKPVAICQGDFELFKPVPVYIRSHRGQWIKATAKQCSRDAATLFIESEEQIEGGTSGGPIINEAGELVAIVSHSSEGQRGCDGLAPRPHLTLPVWVCRKILRCPTLARFDQRPTSRNNRSGTPEWTHLTMEMQ